MARRGEERRENKIRVWQTIRQTDEQTDLEQGKTTWRLISTETQPVKQQDEETLNQQRRVYLIRQIPFLIDPIQTKFHPHIDG